MSERMDVLVEVLTALTKRKKYFEERGADMELRLSENGEAREMVKGLDDAIAEVMIMIREAA